MSDESRTRRDEQMRKYSKMDKRVKVKLVRSRRGTEEDRMPKNILTQELEGTKKKGKTQEKMERGSRDLQVLGVRRWRELVADRKKWKDIVRQAKAHSGL